MNKNPNREMTPKEAWSAFLTLAGVVVLVAAICLVCNAPLGEVSLLNGHLY